MNRFRVREPQEILFLFGLLLLVVALFSLLDSRRRAELEMARPLPGLESALTERF